MSSVTKATRESRLKEFTDVTGASPTEATRFLKLANWRLEAGLDGFYNDPAAVRAAEVYREQSKGPSTSKNLEKLWEVYRDPKNPEEIAIEGTIKYCEDLGVAPEDVVMLALAWLTKAPTMGRFARKGWIEGWKSLGKDTIQQQKAHINLLRTNLKDADTFRKVYNFTFDYARDESQKSMQLDIATELWNLLLPLDPAGSFPLEHLAWWQDFLVSRGSRAVSKDTWTLFLEFTRSIDPLFLMHDEEAAWPSLIDDFVEYAKGKLAT